MSCQAFFAILLLVLCAPNAISEETPRPAIAGYVTAITSATVFDVNGTHILCDSKTQFSSSIDEKKFVANTVQAAYIGEPVDIYGNANKKSHTIIATEVIAYPPQPKQLSGFAIIDEIPDSPKGATPGGRLLRADGYRILITGKTQKIFNPPLVDLSSVGTNVWIKYSGKLRPDGIFTADAAEFTANIIPKGEDKLRTKNEYDPKTVDPKHQQSGASKFFLGTKIKRIPPYNDAAMQSRIDRIGASLVPAYQRNLSVSDATKINFRFQLVDQPKWHDAMTLPNGIILVPRQIVERLENDSQVATVLADNIATALEKQSFREQPAVHKMTAAQWASDAGGIFVPGLGIATGVANYKIAKSMLRHAEEQSGRVSLGYLHDTGYNVFEAPRAWWLLAPKKPMDIQKIDLPERAAYLYSIIGQTWRINTGKSQSSANLLLPSPNP